MSLESVPAFVWWIAGALVVCASIIAAYALGGWAYGSLSRRYLIQVVSRREGVRASYETLEAVVRDGANAHEMTEGRRVRSAAEDHKTLIDLAHRMEIVSDELDTMPLPRSLWPSANALADAAFIIAEEARRVGESDEPDAVRAALSEVDPKRAAAAFAAADVTVRHASERYGLDEAAVYGGGLYI